MEKFLKTVSMVLEKMYSDSANLLVLCSTVVVFTTSKQLITHPRLMFLFY